MKMKIKNDERGLLFKDGNYIKSLKPGKYRFNPFVDYKVILMDVNKVFDVPTRNLNLFLSDSELLNELSVVDVQDYQIAIHYEDGKLFEVLKSGKYAFWNILKKHEFIIIDTREPEVKENMKLPSITILKFQDM